MKISDSTGYSGNFPLYSKLSCRSHFMLMDGDQTACITVRLRESKKPHMSLRGLRQDSSKQESPQTLFWLLRKLTAIHASPPESPYRPADEW